jgi:hypothetical protein
VAAKGPGRHGRLGRCATWMERTARGLLAAAQEERTARVNPGRVDSDPVCKVGGLLRTRSEELLEVRVANLYPPRAAAPRRRLACAADGPLVRARPTTPGT